jgi:hypothetical protein
MLACGGLDLPSRAATHPHGIFSATRPRLATTAFSATRPRLATTASSRPSSRSPEAASGGRPSSVIALRTAAQ